MLEGKHALVTGGGTGIGLAVAQALAAQGAQVTITGRRLGVLEAAAQNAPGLHSLAMDVATAEEVQQATEEAVAARGPIAICVANAGVAEGRSIFKTDEEFWRHMMSINLDGAYRTIRAAMQSMSGLDWGRVIAISSIAGIKGLKGAPAYSASKFGVIGLIKSLSQDFAGKGITFNAICPAYVETEIIDRNVVSISQRAGVSEEQARQMMVGLNPHGRLITVDEVAAAATWLCGPGSGSTNGQAVEISGGVM
ncbi:D-beta-hydroxybutyrate dehydrogenase [Candidatus Rhodobacter oscarellae]|uniref:D-beta-hydroxybutyrate dehydrogenase n=1 Tax=Candidatus Rhodobacter oscarellae TaxID=1675527 RepID=A0A0J9GS84_9RHOB|nr:SDR family oxidoreductase [Candidatus Rhodobacter lobularis]KMW56343.1 D-beta-hydroxybutyrate dehydrogenase [Candidatus Rhodobacter lobularis]